MDKAAMTPAERHFAAENHRLIYTFLEQNDLSTDDYYDIVVFGYLAAVCRYSADPALQRYAFSTIAWRSMRRSMSDYLRAESREKRQAAVVSLDAPVTAPDGIHPREWPIIQHELLVRLEIELLLCDVASRVSPKEMELIRMRMAGMSIAAIAKAWKTTSKKISKLLSVLLDVVLDACYGHT